MINNWFCSEACMFEYHTLGNIRINRFLNVDVVIVMVYLHVLVGFKQSILISFYLFLIPVQLLVVELSYHLLFFTN